MKFDRSLIPPSPNLSFEMELWARGVRLVAGIDEAGRGSLAGPVAAGVVILPPERDLEQRLVGVRDSKEMTPAARETWAGRLAEIALGYAVGFASAAEIDQVGIVPATRLACCRALQALSSTPQHLLLDYLQLAEVSLPQTSLVKGDARSLSIAAASIFAKTRRDALMRELDRQYPGYDLAVHKGYGTARHRQALSELGYSAIHRKTFRFEK